MSWFLATLGAFAVVSLWEIAGELRLIREELEKRK